MSSTSWRYAFASVIGTGHVRAGLPCQDYSQCEILKTTNGEPILISVVADGAGSASESAIGAEIACNEIIIEITNCIFNADNLLNVNRKFAEDCIEKIQFKLAKYADDTGGKLRDFACTLLVAIIGQGQIITWQIGDGAIVYSDPNTPEHYSVINWPQKGEYENLTSFLTQSDAIDHLQFDSVIAYVDEIAILTDGLQRLALDFSIQNAHSPFFRNMFVPLRVQTSGYSKTASIALKSLLSSERVNERTDDDKTLVLASRRTEFVLDTKHEDKIDAQDILQ